MTNKSPLILEQHSFPFAKRLFTIDLISKKIKITEKTLLKSGEMEVDLQEVNEQPQRVKKLSLSWFLLAIISTLYLVFFLSSWFWGNFLLNAQQDSFIVGFHQLLLLACVGGCWKQWFRNSYNITIFYNKFTNRVAFSLYNDQPNSTVFADFVTTLKVLIREYDNNRSIQTILTNIPTHILVEQFSFSYIEELHKRGINVSSLLSFLQKKAVNQQQTLQ